jgi:hypothetical protein
LLIPFLAGGVVVGDEALLLKSVRGFDSSALDFGAYARSPEGWYIVHHVLWFGLIYATSHIAALLQAGPLVTEAAISCQTVMAGLAAIVFCYTFLVRRLGMEFTRSVFTVLAFFAGGFGVYTFCMAGAVESYMVLAMSARLFLAETTIETRDIWKLVIIDAVLVALKAYSLIFLVITWPLLRISARTRVFYGFQFGTAVLGLICVKLWLWNPVYASAIGSFSFSESLGRLVEQFFSPWTGLLLCLPVLLVLFSPGQVHRKSLYFKGAGILGCAAFFSLYNFFNGDVAGGRYIFPFVVALLPEVAAAISLLLDRNLRLAWLLPLVVFAFLPVAGLGNPFFPDGAVPPLGPCHPDHPVVRSWKLAIAKAIDRQQVEICFRGERYILSARDAASPHLGPWRVAYMLDGGHSPAYRAVAHDQGQKQHDAWGTQLADWLRNVGLGAPWFWVALGLMPAILVLWLSIWSAIRINRPSAIVRHAQ